MTTLPADAPEVVDLLDRAMVARIATVSRHGRPNVNPLYFVVRDGRIHLGTADETLAARNVRADPRVTLLFEDERDPADRRIVRIRGRATVRTDAPARRAYLWGDVRKYILGPAGLANLAAHAGQLRAWWWYARSSEHGRSCVIEVVPERAEIRTGVLG